MNRFYCTTCGRFAYSAARLKDLTSDSCPDPDCGGHLIPADDDQKCRVCGCTWDHACPGGCYWAEPDLCSACASKVKEAQS